MLNKFCQLFGSGRGPNREGNAELIVLYVLGRFTNLNVWPVSRYGEQKFRLKRCGVENVIYLVEGKMSGASRSQGVAALKTAMLMCKVKGRDSNAKQMRGCIILVIFRTATVVASDIRGSHHTPYLHPPSHRHTHTQHQNTTQRKVHL